MAVARAPSTVFARIETVDARLGCVYRSSDPRFPFPRSAYARKTSERSSARPRALEDATSAALGRFFPAERRLFAQAAPEISVARLDLYAAVSSARVDAFSRVGSLVSAA